MDCRSNIYRAGKNINQKGLSMKGDVVDRTKHLAIDHDEHVVEKVWEALDDGLTVEIVWESLNLIQYFTNWIRKSSSFIPISKYFSVKCLKS